VAFTPQTQALSGFYVNVPSNRPTFKILVGGESVASLPSKVITINNEDDYTTSGSVTLSLSAPSYPANISEMCVSNTASCSSWVGYSSPTQVGWGLTSGDGVKAERPSEDLHPMLSHSGLNKPIKTLGRKGAISL
jgi:hypothetical protein